MSVSLTKIASTYAITEHNSMIMTGGVVKVAADTVTIKVRSARGAFSGLNYSLDLRGVLVTVPKIACDLYCRTLPPVKASFGGDWMLNRNDPDGLADWFARSI